MGFGAVYYGGDFVEVEGEDPLTGGGAGGLAGGVDAAGCGDEHVD